MRISGRGTAAVLDALSVRLPPPRLAALRSIRKSNGELVDRGLVLWLPGPGSYTGEDSAELHLHGGRAVLQAVSEALLEAGARPAAPGAFTRRALLNGRIDLLEAEAIADLVDAETASQRRQSLLQLDGALGDVFRAWSQRITRVLAQQEALIDFPDEDLPPDIEMGLVGEIAAIEREMRLHLDDGHRGERLRDGLVFAIAGPPNVGKSTLINMLAARDVAIVAATAGTTRDVLEVRLDLDGVPVTLLDTAGLRDAADPVEAEGIRRARSRIEGADLVIFLNDGALGDAEPVLTDSPARVLHVATKRDLGHATGVGAIAISALTGEGMPVLLRALTDEAIAMTSQAGPPPLTRARHRAGLSDAADRLADAGVATLAELRGEDLRMSLRCIGAVTGVVGTEEILDSVFTQFCIGK